MQIEDALDVARALKRAGVDGGGCARLYDASGITTCVVSWAPADRIACVLVPGAGPQGADALLSIPEENL